MPGSGQTDLDDWRQFGTGLVGLQAVERGNSLLAFRMDDRKQRIVIDRSMAEGARFFGWEVADAAALDALAARLEGVGVAVTAEPQSLRINRRVRAPDFVSRSRPAIGWRHFTAPRSTTRRSSPGRSISGFRTGPLGLGHAVLTVDNIDAGDGVLRRRARLRALRLHRKAISRLFLPHQRAASLAGADRDRQERHASPDGRTVLARRCRPVLRRRIERAGSRQRHAGTSHQRFHDVVLRQDAVILHGRMRLGRPRDRSFELATGRNARTARACGGTSASGCRRKTAKWRARCGCAPRLPACARRSRSWRAITS